MTHLDAREWMVDVVAMSQAREMVADLHYARGSSNTAVFRHGLFRRSEWPLFISGVALWLPPTRTAAESTLRDLGIDDGDWRRVLALSRLVVAEDVPTNGASFLIGRSVRLIRRSGNWDLLVTYADRRFGHTGAIYRATNWEYVGESRAYSWSLDGKQVARKAAGRSRTFDEMRAMGAAYLDPESRAKFVMRLA